MIRLTSLPLFLLAALPALVASQDVSSKTIPGTEANQDYFAQTQALFVTGNKSTSSCGPEIPSIESCIRSCNRPGLQERSGCCCVATPQRDFFVGIRGGCRYRQQLLNFTTRLAYVSEPVEDGPRFFDDISCAPSGANVTGGSCTCSIKWEATAEELELAAPLPSPTPSSTPGLSPSAKPSPSAPPVPQVSPVTPTRTPRPQTSAVAIDLPSVTSSPSEVDPAETVDPSPAQPGSAAGATETPEDSGDGGEDGEVVSPIVPPGGGDNQGPTEPSDTPDVPMGGSPGADIEEIGPTPGEDGTDGAAVPSVDGTEGPDLEPGESAEASIPPDTDPTPTPEDDGTVCIDEKHLFAAGFDRTHMVHPHGIVQRVLCPKIDGLPCGTPDHKLRRFGKGLSYGELCSTVECSHDIKVVNSVYSHLWTETVHQDVVLTMYDVRYHEKAQILLHSVMRFARRALARL